MGNTDPPRLGTVKKIDPVGFYRQTVEALAQHLEAGWTKDIAVPRLDYFRMLRIMKALGLKAEDFPMHSKFTLDSAEKWMTEKTGPHELLRYHVLEIGVVALRARAASEIPELLQLPAGFRDDPVREPPRPTGRAGRRHLTVVRVPGNDK